MKKEMRQNVVVVQLETFGLWLLCSCATMMSGTHPQIHLEGDANGPVTITTSYAVYDSVDLPATVKVKGKHLEGQRIRIESDSTLYQDIVLRRSVNAWTLGNLYGGGIVGLGIDLLTNAVSQPAQNHFHVWPTDSSEVAAWRAVPVASPGRHERPVQRRLHRHELTLGVGFGANMADHGVRQMVSPYESHYGLKASGECFDVIGDSHVLTNLEYHYRLNKRWAVGVVVAWGLSRQDYDDDGVSNANRYDGIDTRELPSGAIGIYGSEMSRFFIVAPSVKHVWHESAHGRCYSRVALGMMRQHLTFDCEQNLWREGILSPFIEPNDGGYSSMLIAQTDCVKWKVAYQVTAIGATVGTGALHLFGELGYGCLGIVAMGIGLDL